MKTIIADMQKRFNKIPGLNVYLRLGNDVDLGQDEGRSQYSAAIESPYAEELYRWAPRLKTKLQSLPELANCLQRPADERAASECRRSAANLAMSLGVDPEKIANTLYDAYGNRRADTITVASERYDLILEGRKTVSARPRGPGDLYIQSNTGRLVPLSAVTTSTRRR